MRQMRWFSCLKAAAAAAADAKNQMSAVVLRFLKRSSTRTVFFLGGNSERASAHKQGALEESKSLRCRCRCGRRRQVAEVDRDEWFPCGRP